MKIGGPIEASNLYVKFTPSSKISADENRRPH